MSAPAASVPAARRLLFVHAHPDDESIGTGVTMARYVDEGVAVTLVTCTLGEEGEVLIPELAHLAVAHTDDLGPHRQAELAAAMRVLGVTDHRLLGGAGRWRDSGMQDTPANDRPDCFWRADLLEAAGELVAVIREVRPQVLVTYDTIGGYGHPDHVQAHRVATYAVALAAVASFRPDLGPAWDVAKGYWTAVPRSLVQRGIDALVAAGGTGFFGVSRAEDIPWLVDDDVVTTRIDGREQEPRKLAALRAHASQVGEEAPFFALAEHIGPDALGYEFFVLAKGSAVATDDGIETDLFAGL